MSHDCVCLSMDTRIVDDLVKLVLNSCPLKFSGRLESFGIPYSSRVTSCHTRGRGNHQRALVSAVTGVVQSRERGCERLEREQGASVVRRQSDRCVTLLTFTQPFCDGMAPQGTGKTRNPLGSALPFAQAFTTGN